MTTKAEARQRRFAKERFGHAQKLEMEYMRSLRQLTRQIDAIIKGMAPGGVVRDSVELQTALRQYSQAITPWARAVAEKMLARIVKKDESAWMQLGKSIGKSLRRELEIAPTGIILQEFLTEQVKLITSLPIDAANRVHKLTTEGMITGRRSEDIAKDILQTGKVTESRAKLIARTEVARTASGITMARAKFVGSQYYVWRTCSDGDVRKSHKAMNGAVIPFDHAPEVEPGKRYHAGCFPNCRCYIDPILIDE